MKVDTKGRMATNGVSILNCFFCTNSDPVVADYRALISLGSDAI